MERERRNNRYVRDRILLCIEVAKHDIDRMVEATQTATMPHIQSEKFIQSGRQVYALLRDAENAARQVDEQQLFAESQFDGS
jgi:hypothetical protein